MRDTIAGKGASVQNDENRLEMGDNIMVRTPTGDLVKIGVLLDIDWHTSRTGEHVPTQLLINKDGMLWILPIGSMSTRSLSKQ